MIGKILCEALGLDPSKVMSIDISVNGHDVPKVTIGYVLTMDGATVLGTTLKDYELVEK